jgi:hypothetical protein
VRPSKEEVANSGADEVVKAARSLPFRNYPTSRAFVGALHRLNLYVLLMCCECVANVLLMCC